MARKVSLIVIWPSFESKIVVRYLMSNGIIILKRPDISLIIATRDSECENNLWEVMAWESFPIADFDPFFNVKWGNFTTKGLYLPHFL